MATVRFFDGNGGVYNYDNFRDFDIVSATETRAVAIYDEEQAGEPYNPNEHVYRMVITVADGEMITPTNGPRAGEQVYVSGEITHMRFYNDTGDLLMLISGLSAPIATVQALSDDNAYDLWDFIMQGGHTYIGSDDSSTGPDQWDGDDMETTIFDDTVRGNDGNDYIKDLGGTDDYNGGDGWDYLSYTDWYYNPAGMLSGINANLATGTVVGPDGETDTIRNIEGVRGTVMDDVFKGNGGENWFLGYAGDDSIDGGGGLFDVASYRNEHRQGGFQGIDAKLTSGTVIDTYGHTDTLIRIEGIQGSEFSDRIRDNGQGNYLEGRNGNDTLIFSRGDDYGVGGEGADRFIFVGNDVDHNQIRDFDANEGDVVCVKNEDFANMTVVEDSAGVRVLWDAGDQSIYFENLSAADITSDMFI